MSSERIASRARLERAFREFCLAVVEKRELSNADVIMLLGDQLRVGTNDTYYLDETGVRRAPVSDIEQRKLFKHEVISLWEAGTDARLDFPCTHERFAEWLARNPSFSAPDEYLKALSVHRDRERKEAERKERERAKAVAATAAAELEARTAEESERRLAIRTQIEREIREKAEADAAADKVRRDRGGAARVAEVQRLVSRVLEAARRLELRPEWRRDRMPGIKRDLADVLRTLSPCILGGISDATFETYFKRLNVKFGPGGKSKQFFGYIIVLNEITKNLG